MEIAKEKFQGILVLCSSQWERRYGWMQSFMASGPLRGAVTFISHLNGTS